jgi:serine/threonine protein kinase
MNAHGNHVSEKSVSSAIINCRSIVSGFAHLDIKPENCLRTKFGLTKLSDFGLSCYVKTDLKHLFPNKQNFKASLSLPLRTKNGIRCAGTPLYSP